MKAAKSIKKAANKVEVAKNLALVAPVLAQREVTQENVKEALKVVKHAKAMASSSSSASSSRRRTRSMSAASGGGAGGGAGAGAGAGASSADGDILMM